MLTEMEGLRMFTRFFDEEEEVVEGWEGERGLVAEISPPFPALAVAAVTATTPPHAENGTREFPLLDPAAASTTAVAATNAMMMMMMMMMRMPDRAALQSLPPGPFCGEDAGGVGMGRGRDQGRDRDWDCGPAPDRDGRVRNPQGVEEVMSAEEFFWWSGVGMGGRWAVGGGR